jgi:L-ascorbate 6-phosphate lactonase
MSMKLAEQIRTFQVAPQTNVIWGLGQMGLCIKDDDQRVTIIDPILSNIVAETFPEDAPLYKREFDAPLLPEEINFANLILCTHEHLDHADPVTLAGILKASPQAQVYSSSWAIESLQKAGLNTNRMQVAMPGKCFQQGNFSVSSLPSAHYEVETDPQKGSRWLGFVLDWGWMRLYHSGDTILYPGLFEALKPFTPIRVMMLPVNGRDAAREAKGITGNLHLAEAQQLAMACSTETVLIGHNDLFAFNSIPLESQHTSLTKVGLQQPLYLELHAGQQMVYRKG